ncbi:T7SS effector LXG polymorphic toxin [Bacillus inaquosorum]|uniref:ribonuclease YeeF family protein n=2 Tax=Bacillus inaquosorum TaxID=483913 RepID=UPI00227FAA16|nr:T7SS effector LXG polymorphic toxin [Bacillus inaquosorum]MCY7979926.1 T7SS effector LXG polymorphic toxin [Bacillus inaquosorum]MCY8753055.1 T7SS effector LXG polymorphic toxin [Bacillus inaquosorum]MCY9343674.1 T7SS effector LXG polymorphic toxin [Bacillus inaquosorum]MEC0679567.1 T7SS effector LXG polymorphic toxin [Bacillus inaquosorum]MEC3623356.1 T7SS effector LXG polymorphic toxin [Bacillus inaquosorum]
MKTLDVHALHEGIQHTIEKLDKQKQQLEKLEKSVEHLAGMKDALKGKGGDAIRTFYEECHKPFLLFFGMFIDEYKKVLKQTQHGISSVESDSHGMIAEAFLSHDARHGVKHAREVTEQLTDAVNRQTSAIDHIVSLPTVNDTFFRMETEQAERLITDTLHKLFQFDGQQTQTLETAKSDFQTMKKYIDQLENMYTGPKIEITGYKSGSILKSQGEENINQTFGAINPQMKQAADSPMEMMLKKLEKHKQSNVDSVIMDDKQQKIEREIYGDDSNLTVLQKEAAAHPKVYGDIRVINDKLYNHKGLKKIDTIQVIDELESDTASMDYVGGKYFVYENGQIVREFYAGGKKRLEEVSYIPEDKVGGAKPLDSFLAGTQYEFIEWVSPQGAVKKLAVRGGKRVVTDVAKHVAEKESKGEVNKVAAKVTGNIQTGGRELSIDEYLKQLDKADEMYKVFRKSKTDVQSIANNTGMTKQRVQRIKEHLFIREHKKEHGIGRFDPDYEIAKAWDRLQRGTYHKNDIDLLNHELFESKFEGIFKTDYRTAHDKTVKSGRPWYPPEEE